MQRWCLHLACLEAQEGFDCDADLERHHHISHGNPTNDCSQINVLNAHSQTVSKLSRDAAELLTSGDVDAAVELFSAILDLDPKLEPQLWQRGLALFYAGRYSEGARQFKADLRVNDTDVEEVIWHHLCARRAAPHAPPPPLLPCRADNRAVMMQILELFQDKRAPKDVVGVHPTSTAYAHFYVALWYTSRGRSQAALPHFVAAAARPSDDFMGLIMKMHGARAKREAALAAAVPRLPLGNYDCPRLIVGGWQLSSGHSTHPESNLVAMRLRCQADLAAHAERGLVAFDFGDIYTGVEIIVGRFVRDYVARGGSRSSLRLHTKLVPDLDALATYSEAQIRAIVTRSCARLQSSYVDLVQFHWWDLSVRRYVDVALQLTVLRSEGLIREIGLTNFALAETREMVLAGVPIVSNQVQLSLLDRRVETSGLSAYCAEQGISILPYGALAGGLLSDRYLGKQRPPVDASQHETRSLTKYLLVLDEAGGWDALQSLLRALRSIADRASQQAGREVSIADVALAWVLSRPAVGAAIVGARGVGRLDSMVASVSLTLSAELLLEATVASDKALKPVPGDVYALERVRDGPHGSIMRYNLQQMRGLEAAAELEDRVMATREALEAERKIRGNSPAARTLAARRFLFQAKMLLNEGQRLVESTKQESDKLKVRTSAVVEGLTGDVDAFTREANHGQAY